VFCVICCFSSVEPVELPFKKGDIMRVIAQVSSVVMQNQPAVFSFKIEKQCYPLCGWAFDG